SWFRGYRGDELGQFGSGSEGPSIDASVTNVAPASSGPDRSSVQCSSAKPVWIVIGVNSVPSYAQTRALLPASSDVNGGNSGGFCFAACSTFDEGTNDNAEFGIRVACSRRAPSNVTLAVMPGRSVSSGFSTVITSGCITTGVRLRDGSGDAGSAASSSSA